MQRKWAHLGRQHSSQGSKRTSNCLDEFHERSPYAVRQENYAGNPLNSYVGMNFTRDNAEIPAWMMCTEVHENGLPAAVRKSPRGSASEKCLISQCHPSRSVAGDRLYFKIPTFRTGLGRRYTRCEVLPLQTKEHLCLNTGFTLEPWQRYVVPAGTVNENVSEVLVSMPLLMLALQ